MFEGQPDSKPASIIITTIAAHAYTAGATLAQTLDSVLGALSRLVASGSNEVLNPVDPAENFADRWSRPDCAHLQLKKNFHNWVSQAVADLGRLRLLENDQAAADFTRERFRASLPSVAVSGADGRPARRVTIGADPPRPWRK
jgi:hypothetical protein